MSQIDVDSLNTAIDGKQNTITGSTNLEMSICKIHDKLYANSFFMKDSTGTTSYLTFANDSTDNYRNINSGATGGIYIENKVCINTYTETAYGLYVPAGNLTYGNAYLSFFNATIDLRYLYTNFSETCARIVGTVLVGNRVASNSDKRIKTNIQDINDDSALQMIMKVEPKTYEYIDKFRRGNGRIYGFIAQQIKNVIPKAVSFEPLFIPNIYKVGTLNNSNIITMDMDISDKIAIGSNITLLTSNLDKDDEFTVTSVNSNQFTINRDIKDYDNIVNSNIFVYGTKVNDFHILEKSYIYTLNVCATQELYKIIQCQITKINQLKNNCEIMANKIREQQEEINMIINNNNGGG